MRKLLLDYIKDRKYYNAVIECVFNLWADGFKIQLPNTEHVMVDGDECSGYIDEDNKEFVVAMRSNTSKEVFIHEYCHYLQWKENEPTHLALKVYGKCSTEILQEWLSEDIELTPEEAKNVCVRVGMMERNCEMRVVEFFKQRNLKLDVKSYIKAANAYVTIYYVMAESRKWCNKKAPYRVKELMKLMPDTFECDYEKLAKDTKHLYYRHCF